ncbi:primase C-terminal domain-containing protein [Solibacillus sp. NPDC093137]|uniref:primase C-terminal domain-containing protein n=1 Tax=Solibacillus sp. NPDC093137 TaxID=3390678 RepID=UPI003CFC0BAA
MRMALKIESFYTTLLKNNHNAIIFGVEKKSDFSNISSTGKVFQSNEILLKSLCKLSHFTPNTYNLLSRKSPEKCLYGFTEQNLKQINTFVVDIDTLKYSLQDILLACIDNSIGAPTMVIRTPNGYQVYFVLSKPMKISSNGNFLSLNIAKRIALNLKESLVSVEADRYCNDFGFFRVPKESNIVWLQLGDIYSPEAMITWSEKMDDDKGRSLFTTYIKQMNMNYLESSAFQKILSLTCIQGHKGKLGRNNTIFTIALACYADGLPTTDATKLISKFNNGLKSPLKLTEIQASIRSAYSGRYNGPDKIYIDQILEGYQIDQPYTNWYKFKKVRSERKYSHIHEWESDLITYLESIPLNNTPYITLTQKQICKQIGCQQSTLNALLKKSNKIIKVVTGKGRAAVTKWSTINIIIKYFALKHKEITETKSRYKKYLRNTIITKYSHSSNLPTGIFDVPTNIAINTS